MNLLCSQGRSPWLVAGGLVLLDKRMTLIRISFPLSLRGVCFAGTGGCFLCRVTLRCLAISRIAFVQHLDILVFKMCACLTCWTVAPWKAGVGVEQLLWAGGCSGASIFRWQSASLGEAVGVGIPWSPLFPPIRSGQPLAVLKALGNSWDLSPCLPCGVALVRVFKIELYVKLISRRCCW